MKTSVIIALVSAITISSCKQEEAPIVQCENGFIRENNECKCPLPPLAYVTDNGNACYRLNPGEYAAEFDIPCFWPKLLVLKLPTVDQTREGEPIGISVNGDDKNTNKFRMKMGAYYHYAKGNVDSFSVSFIDNSDNCEATGERFILTGINKAGKPVNTAVHTVNATGDITSSWPVSFN